MNSTHEELVERAKDFADFLDIENVGGSRIVRDLLTRNAELEAWNAQFLAGCDGKCALYECVCPTDEDKERIAELEAEKQWQPIETAPKDGTVFQAITHAEWGADDLRGEKAGWLQLPRLPFNCKWNPDFYEDEPEDEAGAWVEVDKCGLGDEEASPIHWMPLPELPVDGVPTANPDMGNHISLPTPPKEQTR